MTSLGKLERLIERRSEPNADIAVIEQLIWEQFGQRWCVVFTDMTGFSQRSARDGIVGFLSHMLAMRRIVLPIIAKHKGHVLKHIADSQMILFKSPVRALDACIAMERAIFAYNALRTEPDRIYLGCGIGYGDVLMLDDEDVYGVEVNFAAKLGEDLAGPYEILLTGAVSEAIGEYEDVKFARVRGGRLGGTRQGYFRAEYEMPQGEDAVRRAKHQRARFK